MRDLPRPRNVLGQTGPGAEGTERAQDGAEPVVRVALSEGMILGEGVLIVLAGLVLGLAVAAALSRAVAGLLFSTAATDPLTYGAIAALVMLVSLAATWIPARRATRVDPLAALREA